MDRLADVAGDVIENADRGAELDGAAVLGADAAGHGEAGLGAREFAGEPGHRFRRHARRLRRPLGGVRGEHPAERIRIGGRAGPLREDHVGHREREHRLAAGCHRVPLVGVESGEVAARPDVDRLRHLAVLEPVALGVAGLVLDRREPGLQEVGPERDDVAGPGEIMRRELVQAEYAGVGEPHRVVIERLPPGDPPAQRRWSTPEAEC